jgi:DNA-directed RNA polymerase subunit beta'
LLTDGSADPKEIFKVAGQDVAQEYLITEIAKVYELHGTGVDRKHLELIVRMMFSRRKVTEPGDSLFTTGQVVENITLEEENQRLEAEGKMPATAQNLLMGITDTPTACLSPQRCKDVRTSFVV